jgi:hypothetical protein
MINPLTFFWEDGMPLRLGAGQAAISDKKYYGRAMIDPQKWKRLVTGNAETKTIMAFVLRHIAKLTRNTTKSILDYLRLSAPTRLASELGEIADKGVPITFFFSSRDLGFDLLREEAMSAERRLHERGSLRYHFIDDGDHTFSRSRERELFMDTFVKVAKQLPE